MAAAEAFESREKRLATIASGEQQLQEVVSAAEGLLLALHQGTSVPAFWTFPQSIATRNPSSTPEREPLAQFIESAHLRYRAASDSLQDVLVLLKEKDQGDRDHSLREGQQTREEPMAEASGLQEESHEKACKEDTKSNEKQPVEEASPKEAQPGDSRSVPQKEAAELDRLKARRDELKKTVAERNELLDSLSAKLHGIVDAAALWQSAALVRPPTLNSKDGPVC